MQIAIVDASSQPIQTSFAYYRNDASAMVSFPITMLFVKQEAVRNRMRRTSNVSEITMNE